MFDAHKEVMKIIIRREDFDISFQIVYMPLFGELHKYYVVFLQIRAFL